MRKVIRYILNRARMSTRKIKYKLFGREALDKRNRKRLKNDNFTLIASNCNGGVILHDLGLPFNSPFVNLWMKPNDYIRLLSNFEEYMSYELVNYDDDSVSYPVGLLKDVKIFFLHYSSFEEAKSKWDERVQRIVWNNIYVMFTDRDGCSIDDLKRFDALPYKKVVFTHIPYSDIKSSYYFKGFENRESVGVLSTYSDDFLKKRYLDDFDYVRWLNER